MNKLLTLTLLFSLTLTAAPTKLVVIGDATLADMVCAELAGSVDFELFERQEMKAILRELTLPASQLKKIFPHAELIAEIKPRSREDRVLDLSVLNGVTGEKLVRLPLPAKLESAVQLILGGLKTANSKRVRTDLRRLLVEEVDWRTVKSILPSKEQDFLLSRLESALLRFDDVVLLERRELDSILAERNYSHRAFKIMGSTRLGRLIFYIDDRGHVGLDIDIFDFADVRLGGCTFRDVATADQAALSSQWKTVVELLRNSEIADPKAEARRYFALSCEKRGDRALTAAAHALDPENPIYPCYLLYFDLSRNFYEYKQSRQRTSEAQLQFDTLRLPTDRAVLQLEQTLKREENLQSELLPQIRDDAGRIIEMCRNARSQCPDAPTLFKVLLMAAEVIDQMGGDELAIPADQLYSELCRDKRYGSVNFMGSLQFSHSPLLLLGKHPSIQELFNKLLIKEIELREMPKNQEIIIEYPHNSKMADFYASISPEIFQRLKQIGTPQATSLVWLKFLKLLNTPNIDFKLLKEEWKYSHGFPYLALRYYNPDFCRYLSGQRPDTPFNRLNYQLDFCSGERKYFEIVLECYPPELGPDDDLKQMRDAIERQALLQAQQEYNAIYNTVLRKIKSSFRVKDLASWPLAKRYVRGDELFALIPNSGEIFILTLPAGNVKKIGTVKLPAKARIGAFSVTDRYVLIGCDEELWLFDRRTLSMDRRLKSLPYVEMAVLSGERIYVLHNYMILSCSINGGDWRTEFSPYRSKPRFNLEKGLFHFDSIAESSEPGVLSVRGNWAVWSFDFNRGNIAMTTKKADPNELWSKGSLKIISAKHGRILKITCDATDEMEWP